MAFGRRYQPEALNHSPILYKLSCPNSLIKDLLIFVFNYCLDTPGSDWPRLCFGYAELSFGNCMPQVDKSAEEQAERRG